MGCSEDVPTGVDWNPPDVTNPAESRLARLTQTQFRNSVQDIFGEHVVVPAALEPDASIEGMIAIGTTRTSISPWGTEQYETASYSIAAQAMEPGAERDALVTCTPSSSSDEDCATEVLTALGGKLWRRPLTSDEIDVVVTIANTSATTLGDFYDGLEFGIATLLQSPYFLFRVELGEPDPDDSSRLRYSDYEMASRLSYFLWNTTPDDELLAAAERGELTAEDDLREHAQRLLDSPRAREAVRSLFTDLYELYELDDLVKDPTVFTHFSSEVGSAAREETLMVLEDLIFEQRGDFRDVFTSRKTFVNRKLASIYNVAAPEREGFGALEWDDDDPRGGLLTHVSILALNSHPVASSATLRGKFIRQKVLCGIIPPPPANLDTSIPEPSGETPTLRDRVAEHLEGEQCRSCHLLMDPMGLGLENYDALGRFRTHDNDVMIDPSGDVDGEPYADPLDLGRVLAQSQDVSSCLVKHVFRYANNRMENNYERDLLDHIDTRFDASGNDVLELMLDVVMSPGFRTTVPASDEEGGE
jgi:hypothetical protein